MTSIFGHHTLQALSELIRNKLGLHFPEERWDDLTRHVCELARRAPFSPHDTPEQTASASLSFESPQACIRWLLSSAPETERLDVLVKQLTIGETYFFRDEPVFSLLKNLLLPERIRQPGHNKKITLWSAGCSSGEEPYSIAIVVEQVAGLENWDVQVLASDINEFSLNKARKGVYSQWSFRNPPADLIEKYFSARKNARWQLSKAIRDKVQFFPLNLALVPYPEPLHRNGTVDILFCRNVLMYFDHETRNGIIDRFAQLLAHGGWFIVSPSESAFIRHPALSLYRHKSMQIFQKNGKQKTTPYPDHFIAWNTHPIPSPTTKTTKNAPPSPTPKRSQPFPPLRSADTTRSNDEKTAKRSSLEEIHALQKKGQLDEAIEKLHTFLDDTAQLEKTQESAALALLATIHADRGDQEESEKWYRVAIEKDKLNYALYYNLAMLMLEKGSLNETIDLLRKTIFIDQDCILAHFQLASLSTKREEVKKSAHTALYLLEKLPPGEPVPFSEGITIEMLKSALKNRMYHNHV